ncbi:MAG TPA: helix-turn-helix transcriptional regulator [Candidatus Dojkabacteria bacterium]|nr:helix-turn-helix transcriptional regulator [Candidatus Dojkabacteria bacterium]
MKKTKLIPWEDARKEMFTNEQLKELDMKAEKKIAIRMLKELRSKKKLTQEDLAIISGVPRTTISRIETGKRNISIDKLILIANALDRDLEIRFVDRRGNS